MATRQSVELTRAANFRRNLTRIFDRAPRGRQASIARDAGMHPVQLSRVLSGTTENPQIDTIEAIAIALEIPVETLLAAQPSDADLRIF